jgi:hypothetical protein
MLADHDEHVMKLGLGTWRSWIIINHQFTIHLRGVDNQSNEGNSHSHVAQPRKYQSAKTRNDTGNAPLTPSPRRFT